MMDAKESPWYKKLHWQIFAGMVLGAAIGIPVNILTSGGGMDPSVQAYLSKIGGEMGGLFLKLLKMIVVPLVMTSLITGVTNTGNMRGLGRLGWQAMVYYMTTSLLAILVGLVLVNAIEPGVDLDREELGSLASGQETSLIESVQDEKGLGTILWGLVSRLVPDNPVRAMAEGDMLSIIFFSLLFGVFVTLVGGQAGKRLSEFFSAAFEVMMAMTLFILYLAPLGVLGFVLHASVSQGAGVFKALGWYMLTVWIGLCVHAMITLPLLIRLLAARSAWRHAKNMSSALLTAFSTASSNGTLPLTMQCLEKRAGVENRISSFVLPLGATINMDGTALYEAVAALFIAQLYGFDLDLSQQLVVAITALLASVGAAAIPHAGLVMMVIVLEAVGLPTEAVGLIIAVDRLLDMGRTCVNVWSDSVAGLVLQRFQGGNAGLDLKKS